MIEKVDAFKTPDGRLFETSKMAEKQVLRVISQDKLKQVDLAIPSARGYHVSAWELLAMCDSKRFRDKVFDYLEALEDWDHAPTD